MSKAYGVIRRFSEDVDMTYDIRAIAGDLVGDVVTPLPASKSQEKKWTKEIRTRLKAWVLTELTPLLCGELERQGLPATARADEQKVYINYAPLLRGTGYVPSSVMLEFGARSTGEPSELRAISCDVAEHLPDVRFPAVTAHVMCAERTFWEKATAIHVFCIQGAFRGNDRFARHWHDLARLDTAGFADAAIRDKALANMVADHKRIFYAEKNGAGEPIDYHAVVCGKLQLVPEEGALAKLAVDYQRMIDDGLFMDKVESFDVLLEHCRAVQQKANAA